MLINLILIVTLGLSVGAETYTSCSQLPSLTLNYKEYMLASPLKLLLSTESTLTCATAVVTGPGGLGANTNYTFLLLQGNKIKIADSVVTSVASAPEYDCHDGTEGDFRHAEYNFTSANPYLIAYVCNGNAVTLVHAFGRDETVLPTINAAITKYFSFMSGGASAVKSVWTAACSTTAYCGGFFN